MAKKNQNHKIEGLHAEILKQPITQTLEKNYMPYAMSVIVSRAIPEIDGFKPSHRKLLYTMYKMGLLGNSRIKSANVVGQTMKLNPHGDGAIYETMVRLTRGNEAILHPFVDSKGNFGKVYSRDMAYAASRYTEVKLENICNEIFGDIEHNTVDFVDNYDNSTKEPTLLPTAYPNVLVAANQGIAVGMASQMCGFNLGEVCKTTVALLKNPEVDIFETMPAPDFTTGGELIYEQNTMRQIYQTGRGSFKIRSRWRFVKQENVIEVFEIPYSTSAEAILDAVAKNIKEGKLKEVSDMRDETDLHGLKLTIDLKRGVDPEKLMQRLYKMTPLMESFSCNFNLLIAGTPRVMGVKEIITEWTAWRLECVRNRLYFDSQKLREKLHLLKGLQKILLDIDKVINIIRETEEESEVVPNLMIGFRIDELQADYIADIRLRNINKQYILNRLEEISKLENEIAEYDAILADKKKMLGLIIKDLERIDKKYAKPRRTLLIHDYEEAPAVEHIEDYAVNLFVSREGYLKKITPASLRMSGEHKYKEGDEAYQNFEASNKDEILFFTNQHQCYKAKLYEFEDSKTSVLGDYLPSKLNMDEGETVLFTCIPSANYEGYLLFAFENGKVARVELKAYMTVSNRKKLTSAFSDKSLIVAFCNILDDVEMAMISTDGRMLLFHTSSITPKTTRSTQGVQIMSIKPKQRLINMQISTQIEIDNPSRHRVKSLPAAGLPPKVDQHAFTDVE